MKIGDRIRIINMSGEPQYTGKEGEITEIGTEFGETFFRGTWGGLKVYPAEDDIEVIKE